ncbi:MAG: hypothetical protein ACYDHP_05910 [Ferrimicrobium sp.]
MHIEIRGPGHHDRSVLAAQVAETLVEVGLVVEVGMDVRPRLAADITALVNTGATVLLRGEGFVGRATSASELPPVDADVVRIVMAATAEKLGAYCDGVPLEVIAELRLRSISVEVVV